MEDPQNPALPRPSISVGETFDGENGRPHFHRISAEYEGGGQFINIVTQGYVGFKHVLFNISVAPMQLPRCRRFDFGAAFPDFHPSFLHQY